MTHFAAFLLGLATAYAFYRARRWYRLRRAARVLDALTVRDEDRETIPSTPLDLVDWRVHHVDSEPSIEAREERCLMLTRDGRFVEAVTTYEAEDYDECIDRVPFVSAGGDS